MPTIPELQRKYHTLSKELRDNPNGPYSWQLRKSCETLRKTLDNLKPTPKPEPTAEPKPETPSTIRPLSFNFYAVPGSQQAAVLVDRVYDRWTQFRTFQRVPSIQRLQEYRLIIEGVVSNMLYALAMQRPGVFVTRDQSTLARDSRYRPGVYNQKLLTVLDDLHAMKVIEQTKGERWKKEYRGAFGFKGVPLKVPCSRTQLEAAPALEELRSIYRTTRPTDVAFLTERQEVVIVKKDESSALLEYTDTDKPKAIKYRKQVKIINRMLDEAGPLLVEGAEQTHSLDQRQRFLVRKFTYGATTDAGRNLESGGRLWGGFWMNMPKLLRPSVLRIQGQPTVELDFNAIIGHLAYIVADEPTPEGDLWSIPGLSEESRPAIKKLLPALLFKEKPATRFPEGVKELLSPEDQTKTFGQVLELVKSKHPSIAHLFGTGIGHYLQYLESKLIVNILLLCEREKIVALPIHDCLIVAQGEELRVRNLMAQGCLMILGKEIPVKKS